MRRSLHAIFAENLPRLRERADGLTQAALAARTGLSLGTISQYEQGKRAPSLETITVLAGALGYADRPWRLLVPPGER
jgi:transcriptional regulator with XRE-family HTH domain